MDKLRFVKQSSGRNLPVRVFLTYSDTPKFDTLYARYSTSLGSRHGKITSWKKNQTPGNATFYNNFKLELVYE
jgi:hypothetical protein